MPRRKEPIIPDAVLEGPQVELLGAATIEASTI
jgi:hypothetical protein